MSIEVQKDIRVVVSIDFGTTFSGYAYAHKETPKNITVQSEWDKAAGFFKTPTVIMYENDSYDKVKSWGFPALAEKPGKKNKLKQSSKPIELFKLHLVKSLKEKPFLPKDLNYKNVIRDYMRKLGDHVKESIDRHWKNTVDFYKNVLIVLTVPAEFDEKPIAIFRECAVNAGLLKDKYSDNLKFTTEPEAAALYCLDNPAMREENKLTPGASFMVVDCGGGTVDLTTRELLEDESLSEITLRTGDFCGSSFIDQAFLKFVEKKVGESAIESVKNDHYGQLQYLVQEFCKEAKLKFTGIKDVSKPPLEFDLEVSLPAILQYVKGEEKKKMEKEEWIIKLEFEDIKEMFDPVIDKIIHLIKKQLDENEKGCSAIFLVGGFSESKYLQTRIKEEFDKDVPNISVPPRPITSVVKGGVLYGLQERTVKYRKLVRTYGTEIVRRWKKPDPLSQRLPNGFTAAFEKVAQRGALSSREDKFTKKFKPLSLLQEKMNFDLYITEKNDAKFCDDPGVKLLRNWEIDLPENEDFGDTIISFSLSFFDINIEATAENTKTGEKYQCRFKDEE
ncbi:hypothetical protein GLOIN_2v1881619 [Rhizophagus clarus]|uniref:Actin-like ATPase domain-containing protein n=1 Tax=Rhizophagus clarus TaxID=94130 RepID=A0A8H3QZI3_9GLOM|nr:hypothetical protein GLOIN_2v1881619 [Rhizophagus clarus]